MALPTQLDGVLAPVLELLSAAAEPSLLWGPAELRAAFQWADALQQLVDAAGTAAAVRERLEALRPQLPCGLQAALPAVARRPLQTLLERLLARPCPAQPAARAGQQAAQQPGAAAAAPDSSDANSSQWLESVLAAYVAAVVLRRPPGAPQAAAEQALLAALASRQQQAAAAALLHEAAQQAAQHAADGIVLGGAGLGAAGTGALPAERQRALLAEALRHLTSSATLEAAAAGQLLAQSASQAMPGAAPAEQQAQPAGENGQGGEQAAAGPLAGLLHSPPTPLELELLCLLCLLPCWEAVLCRQAGAGAEGTAAGGSWSGTGQPAQAAAASSTAAAAHAIQLLCAACSSQPEALLALHPALPAEVCRCSFRFTCSYTALLAAHQRAALDDTKPVAEAAAWRVAHAAKHLDHVSSYLLSKGCTV